MVEPIPARHTMKAAAAARASLVPKDIELGFLVQAVQVSEAARDEAAPTTADEIFAMRLDSLEEQPGSASIFCEVGFRIGR